MTLTASQRLDVWPNGNPTPEQRAEVAAAHERLKGANPHALTVEEFASIGHAKRPLLTVIRQNCIECMGGMPSEVRSCRATGCPFWPYRMGATPFVSEARREQGRRLAQASRKTPAPGEDPADDSPVGDNPPAHPPQSL